MCTWTLDDGDSLSFSALTLSSHFLHHGTRPPVSPAYDNGGSQMNRVSSYSRGV